MNGGENSKVSDTHEIVHGNFIKGFIQNLTTTILMNNKTASTASISIKNQLLLHNSQIFQDIKNGILTFLYKILFSLLKSLDTKPISKGGKNKKNKIPNPPEAPPTTDDPEIYGKYILEQLKIIKKDLKNNCVYNEKNINTINKLSLSFTRKNLN